MHFRKFIAGLLLLLPALLFAGWRFQVRSIHQQEIQIAHVDTLTEVRITAVGDVMMHKPQINSAQKEGNQFDFSHTFEHFKPMIQTDGIHIANLETTFGGEPYTGFPMFSAPETLAYFLKQTGFTHIITANNHSADKGKKGIVGTINGLQKYGLEQIGTYSDAADKQNRYPFLFRKNKINFAILNYTYGTNGVNVPNPTIVNLIDTTEIKKDLDTARSRGAEFIIMTFHWGHEKNNHYHRSQKEVADFCVRNGVDLIIGSHPHFIQEIETAQSQWNGKQKTCWIVYSLGNFISNQRWRYADGGLFWDCTIQKNHQTNEIQFLKTGFAPVWVYKQLNPIKYFLVPVAAHEKSPLYSLNAKDADDFRIFATDTRKLIQGHLPQIQEIKEW